MKMMNMNELFIDGINEKNTIFMEEESSRMSGISINQQETESIQQWNQLSSSEEQLKTLVSKESLYWICFLDQVQLW